MQKVVVLVAWRSSCKKKVEQWTWYLKPNLFCRDLCLSSTCHDLIFHWRDEKLHWTFYPKTLENSSNHHKTRSFFSYYVSTARIFDRKKKVDRRQFYGEKPQGTTSLFIWQTSNFQFIINLASDRKNWLHRRKFILLMFVHWHLWFVKVAI